MAGLHLYIGNRNYSSWSLRAWLGLVEAGLDFTETVLPLDTEEFRRRIDTITPARRVPVLHVNDHVIWDSLAILEYTAEQAGPGRLWPADAMARAHARSVSAEMHSGFATLRARLPMNIRRTPAAVPVDDELQAEIDRIAAIWADCRRRYGKDGPFLFGEFSIADAMYAPVVMRFPSYEITLDGEAGAYMDTIRAMPSMQRWCAAALEEDWIVAADEV